MSRPPRSAAVALGLLGLISSLAMFSGTPARAAAPPPPDPNQVTLYDGSTVALGADGLGVRTAADGRSARPVALPMPALPSALGDTGASPLDVQQRLAAKDRGLYAPGRVVLSLTSATVDGAPLTRAGTSVAPHTTDPGVNRELQAVGARSMRPLLDPAGGALAGLARTYVVGVAGQDVPAAARALAAAPGVAYASPDWTVDSLATAPRPVPPDLVPAHADGPAPQAGALPTNFGLATSYQSYLNRTGVNLAGAYTAIADRFHQLPGTGETIANVSVGDLTDQAMIDGGDQYVGHYGPTTTVIGGQRYLDYPSLPLIPTYTADANSNLDPLGTVERVDPNLGEVLLDFSVMAPLPHDQQRPGRVGANLTDLLGIAPGAQYRLVEPQELSASGIAAALLAAARQTPKPDVINASLGFGTDTVGFPGRYLEDDPVIRSVVGAIVSHYGIVVTIASNDGTRLYTPAAVGPDGGSTPTDRQRGDQRATTIADDGLSTAPSVVPDTGVIAVGGTTLDDTIGGPGRGGDARSAPGTFAETRLNGGTNFSSGFGSRLDVSAPSDNIAALVHTCSTPPHCTASQARPVLSGGTSAAAPMTAAAAADVLQVSRLVGHPLSPDQVRDLLARTGTPVPTQSQVDTAVQVGPQVNVTAAVESVLRGAGGAPAIAGLSIAHRASIGAGGASFIEIADPADIDLQGPPSVFGPTGEGLVGPLTFAASLTDEPERAVYSLAVNGHRFDSATPAIRVTPTEILTAAGLPVVSAVPRTVAVDYQVRRPSGEVLASVGRSVTFGPSDGTHAMAPAPVVAPVVSAGQPVAVHYDLTGVRGVRDPALIVSSVGHWSAFAAPLFNIAYSVPLTSPTGTVVVPASAFDGGAGTYGVAVEQNTHPGLAGAFAPLLVRSGADDRPAAPTVSAPGSAAGLHAVLDRATPQLGVDWDARGAAGATVEISAPGPTLYGMLNTFVNQNGSGRDNDGVDTGSSVYRALPAAAGHTVLDLGALGLPPSLSYSVRVQATDDRGRPVGQASPVATFDYRDGPAAGSAVVDDLAADSAGAMLAATVTTNPDGSTSSALRRYDPATGTYGATLAADPTGASYYQVYGEDPALHVALVAQLGLAGTEQSLATYDLTTGRQTSSHPIDVRGGYQLVAGRVDPVRHRGAVLAWGAKDGADSVVPVDLATGALGTPVPADNGTPNASFYRLIDIDKATGVVDLGGGVGSDFCVTHKSGFTTVNLDTGAAAPMTVTDRCQDGLAADQQGGAHLVNGPLFNGLTYPPGRTQTVDEATGQVGAVARLAAGDSAIWPVVDPVHHLLIVGFVVGGDFRTNNTAMSAVGVYDLNTGAQVGLNPHVNLLNAAFGPIQNPYYTVESQRGIQLDPTTRTAWTAGPYGTQLQQFHY